MAIGDRRQLAVDMGMAGRQQRKWWAYGGVAIACVVLGYLLGRASWPPDASAPARQPGGSPPSADPSVAPISVATYPDITAITGVLELDQRLTVYQAADEGSTVIATLEPPLSVQLLGCRSRWTLIGWSTSAGTMAFGWALLPCRADAQPPPSGR